MTYVRCAAILIYAAFTTSASAPSLAQSNNLTSKPAQKSSSKHVVTNVPDGPRMDHLIRGTLLSLNDANLTGNYTVFRDLAAPGFRNANNAAKLSALFADLRRNKIDLTPLLHYQPKLVQPPRIGPTGMLRVSGFFPTRPQVVLFDLLFHKVEKRWRIFGISVNTRPAEKLARAPSPKNAKRRN